MSAAPDLGTILGIVSNLDQSSQAKLPPETLLKQFLPALVLPQTRFVRVYRLSDNKAVLQAASDDARPSGTYIPVSTPVYAEALQNLSSAQDTKSGLWVAPLHSTGTTFGFLEVGLPETAEPELDAALQLIAHHLSQALFTATIRDLVQRQASASTELTRSKTFTEMAGVIAAHMLGSGQFITIDLIDYSDTGKLTGMRVIASANRHQTFEATESFALSMEDLGEPLNDVFDSVTPIQVSDIASNNSMSVPLRKWLASHKVEAICLLPMRFGGQTFGLLVINSTEGPLYLSEDELRVYQSLADQVSALVQVHHLVEESTHSQEISERQALAFAELTSGQNFEQMAGVIARHMLPSGGRFLAMNSLLYGAEGELIGFRTLATANRERSFSYDDDTEMPFNFTGLDPLVLQRLHDGALQNGDMREESPETLGEDLYRWFESKGVKYYVNIPLRVEDHTVGMLAVMSKQTPFIKDEINAFRNLADQVAALIYTRDLLSQTSGSLQQTQVLYDVNRSILGAQDTLDVLRALRTYLAPDAGHISHMTVGYDEQNKFKTLIVTHILTPANEQVVQLPLHEMIGTTKLAALQTYWDRQGNRLAIVEDADQPGTNYPLHEFLLAQDMQSFIIIPVRERGLLTDMVNISFNSARTFDEDIRRLYESLSDQIGIVLQNQHLVQEMQANAIQLSRQVEVLQSINELAITLSSILDERSLFDRSSEMLVSTLQVDHCGIVMADPGGVTGTLMGEYPARGSIGTKIDLTSTALYEQVWEHLQPVIIDDVDNRIAESARQILNAMGVKAILILPLVMQGQLVGTIGLDMFTSDRHFTPEMVEIARTMTAQIGVAIQNIRLLTDAQRHAQQLQRIAAFNQSVQATLDMATIFNIGLSESAQMLTLNQMEILLYDPALAQLRTAARFADGKVQITLLDGALIAIDDTIEGRVWKSREFLYVPDESRALDPRQPNMFEPSSHMLAPLQSHGRIMGIVSVICNSPHAYGETDFAVFRQMTNQLAVALENAEAYTQSQRQARNEALVNDIATRLQRQTDIQSMLDITMSEMGKALGARRARIRLATSPDHQEK